MENIFLPQKVEYQPDEKNKDKGQVVIEPCWPGYGTTWGNVLRRVLLTSLPGAAVIAVKIKGVKYEFSAVPGVLEDVLEIILNLKSLHLKILTQEEKMVKLSLKVSGERKVTAGDIEKSAEIEIINQDLLIATLTDKKASLEMDIWVAKGYGWTPSEERSRSGFEVGTIVTDSVFSPILNASVNVENIRVGKRTDFDRIILGIETNGTISPFDAFLYAGRLLKNQFKSLIDLGERIVMPEEKPKKTRKKTTKTVKAIKKNKAKTKGKKK